MSLTFPRDMITGQCWDTARFVLSHRQELSRTAGGEVQAKDLGPPIWQASFETYPLSLDDADALEADFLTLNGSARTFYATPYLSRRAKALPAGHAFDLSAVAVHTISANRDEVRIDGLPANLEIHAGDYLGITTSTGRELHRIAVGGTADGAGLSPLLTVVPNLRASVAVNDLVDIENPMAEMVLIPGTLDKPRESRLRWRVRFDAVQVLR